MAKTDPTTAAELNELTVAQLEKLATKRGVTVLRGDGDEGEPLKEDYVKALTVSPTASPNTYASRQIVETSKYVDAQGRPVNEAGERIDRRGNVLEDE